MKSNIYEIPRVASPMPGINQPLVELLRSLLESAESGHLQSFVGTGFQADGMRVAAWCDTHENVYEMAGALTWLQFEYVKRQTE